MVGILGVRLMNFLDLCAGIGGFRLGMEQAGNRCVGYVEIDKFARKSYEAMYDTRGEWTAHDITESGRHMISQRLRMKRSEPSGGMSSSFAADSHASPSPSRGNGGDSKTPAGQSFSTFADFCEKSGLGGLSLKMLKGCSRMTGGHFPTNPASPYRAGVLRGMENL